MSNLLFWHCLATIFTTSSILSFNVFENSTFFCTNLRPPSPLPSPDPNYYFCPLSAGPLAFSAAIPLGSHGYNLLTINTRLRIVDTSSPAIELGCIDVATTPLKDDRTAGLMYGPATIIFWVSVALCLAYWLVTGLARIVAAWGRGGSGTGRNWWSRLQGAGYILASAISGERFSSTPALLRFSEYTTPCYECDGLMSGRRYSVHARCLFSYSVVCSSRYGGGSMADVCL